MIFTQTKFVSFPVHQRPNCYCRRALIHRSVNIRINTQDDLFHIHNKIHIIEVFQYPYSVI